MSRPSSASSSRRDFLKAASLTSALFGTTAAPLLAQETRKAADNRGLPKKVIFMVSDGMNHGALSLAQHYQSFFKGTQTTWTKMYRELPVVRALVETFSHNSVVTDSAAAASAWGGGQRVNNGTLNISPEGKENETIHSKLKKKGIPTGLVSTATITHATPAGFAANVSTRGDEAEIAAQYYDREVSVLLGGGQKFFSDELQGKFKAKGYDLLKTRKELSDAKGGENKPVLGIFTPGYIPLALDRENEKELQETVPSLAEMAKFAVARLDAIAKDQWFLMVEGARIDHCGHANDAAGSIHEQIAFDEAIAAMLEYVSKHDDVLLIMTTDHGCGGIQLNGVNAKPDQGMAPGIYNGTTDAFRKIEKFTRSFEWMQRSAGLSGPPLRDYVKETTGLTLDDEELKNAQGLKGAALAKIFSRHHGIAWTSGNHTGEMVEFCAYGPGSHLFPAFVRNFEVHHLLLKALGAV